MTARPVREATGLDAATAAATQALLNCCLREDPRWRIAPAEGPDRTHEARLALPGLDAELVAGISHLSPALRHRFALPAGLATGDGPARPLSAHALAALVVDAIARDDPRGAGRPTVLMERFLDSVHAVAGDIDARRDDLERLWGAAPLGFIDSEQALLLGHPTHPTPKSRVEMGDARDAYSPEARARFPLHWLAVEPDLVVHDSAADAPAPALAAALIGDGAPPPGPGDRVLVPAHPWEAAHLRRDPRAAALLDSGRITDLGPLGAPVTPTTSLRTVYHERWPWQLKFSLHVRVTNSMRVTLPKELRRAVEAARLWRTGVGALAARLAPRFVVLHDPAYLAVADEHGLIDGFSVLLRENRWPAAARADVSALTVLCQDGPFGGRSRLGNIVARLAADAGRTEPDVAREWFARYCDVMVLSLVRLYLDAGLCFEPHQQNTLLELERGWPARGVVRDSQGYFHREAAHEDMVGVIPGIGEESESIFPEALADERLVYYPFVNNALGVAAALGLAGVADEAVLLADLRDLLRRERARGGRYPATLLDRLLDDDEWPCKANLRTRLHDLDELVGDISVQSVYVTIPNPLRP
ncbi:MAG: IucA/IucC family siderophore biosynthesis protein [Thermoleophilia bacterium]